MGSQEEFTEFVVDALPRLLRFAHMLTGSPTSAEDLALSDLARALGDLALAGVAAVEVDESGACASVTHPVHELGSSNGGGPHGQGSNPCRWRRGPPGCRFVVLENDLIDRNQLSGGSASRRDDGYIAPCFASSVLARTSP